MDDKKNLLIIDDDPFILLSIKRQLKNENINIELINNPKEGLLLIEKKQFDLILCDIKMEPISGIDVLSAIKERHPDLPVIMLSGYVDDQLIEKAISLGSTKFLIKPIRKKELIIAINNAFS